MQSCNISVWPEGILVPIASAHELVAVAKTDVSFEVVRGAGHNERLFDMQMTDRVNHFMELTGDENTHG